MCGKLIPKPNGRRLGKKYLSDEWDVFSAGIEAHGLNPNAVKVMNELDSDISSQTSDTIDPGILYRTDFVVALCGVAAEKCPMTPQYVKGAHWGWMIQRKQRHCRRKMDVFQRVRE